jgi:hypothetical protein
VSLGAGHVWRTERADGAHFVSIVCVRCNARREGREPRRARHLRSVARDVRVRASTALGSGRPLGTCPEVARRRAAGEAEIRAILDRFE